VRRNPSDGALGIRTILPALAARAEQERREARRDRKLQPDAATRHPAVRGAINLLMIGKGQ
jgi:hypothetical protein